MLSASRKSYHHVLTYSNPIRSCGDRRWFGDSRGTIDALWLEESRITFRESYKRSNTLIISDQGSGSTGILFTQFIQWLIQSLPGGGKIFFVSLTWKSNSQPCHYTFIHNYSILRGGCQWFRVSDGESTIQSIGSIILLGSRRIGRIHWLSAIGVRDEQKSSWQAEMTCRSSK